MAAAAARGGRGGRVREMLVVGVVKGREALGAVVVVEQKSIAVVGKNGDELILQWRLNVVGIAIRWWWRLWLNLCSFSCFLLLMFS